MIGRSTSKASLLAASVLALMIVGCISHPGVAFAASAATQVATVQPSHVVAFTSNGATAEHVTSAKTVGDFLKERGLKLGEADFVSPATSTPLSDKLAVTYRAAVPITIVASKLSRTIVSSAPDVGALLENQNIYLGKHDEVSASLSDPIIAHEVIHITRVMNWTKTTKQHIAQRVIKRIDFALPPGALRVIAQGATGERETVMGFTQRDNGSVQRRVLATRIVRTPRARIIAQGVGEYAAFAQMARFGLQKTSYITASALSMVATAYTAGCYGCTGITASGYRAGHGIVAVDPRVIPLGTRLYIPGYGIAIAGDTGGAILGNRIDLGFNSLSDAIQFGRRAVMVYRLR
ncbi:MAG: 3D domain-containing protein [Vulcanimicrobiaceae bacterium]